MLRFTTVSYSKKSVSCGLALSLVASAAMTNAAEARDGFGIAAGIVGGVVAGALIGGMISNSNRQRQPQRQVRQRQQQPKQTNADSTRVVQQALASLGHYTGPVDGKMAKPTRDGISSFQKSLGDKPTGQLTRKQREVLLAAYAQNTSQGTQTAQQPAPVDNSLHRLLAGGAAAGAATAIGSQVVAQTAPNAQVFLASACASGGAPATSGVVLIGGQPQSVLPDQFCRARNAAISEAARMITPEMGRDVERLRQECRSATEQMAGFSNAAASEPINSLTVRLVREFQPVRQQNAVEAAVGAYKVCLGLGYQEDRADMVLASGLGLVGLGLGGHAEVIGAVLAQAGDAQRTRQAAEWLDYAAGSIEKGAASLDPALGSERATVLRVASRQLRSGGTAPNLSGQVELSNVVQPPRFAVPVPGAAAVQPQAVVPAAPAPAVAALQPAPDRLKGEAKTFFETERALAPARLKQDMELLKLSQADFDNRCHDFLKPENYTSGKPVAPAELGLLRACRNAAYMANSTLMMRMFDQRLADSGDKDATARLVFHNAAGH